MGLSFLKRKKKTKAGFILKDDDDDDDHLHLVQPYKDVADKPILTSRARGDNIINQQQDNNEEDYSVSRYAVLQPASSYGYNSSLLSRSKQRSQSQKSSIRSGSGSGSGSGGGATTPSSYISNKESSASSTRSSGVSTPIMRVETLPEEDEPSPSAVSPAVVSPMYVANHDTPPSQKKTPIHSNLGTTKNNSNAVGNNTNAMPKVESSGNFSQYSLQYQQQFQQQQQQQQENEAAEETRQEDEELKKTKKKKKTKKSKKEKKKSKKKKKEKKQTKQDSSSSSKALTTTITPTNVKKSSSPSMKHFFLKPSKHDTTAISHSATIVSPDQSISTRGHDNSKGEAHNNNTSSDTSLGDNDVLLPSSPVVFRHNHLEEGLELQLLGTHTTTTANYGTSYGATINGGNDGDGEEEEELVFHDGRVLSADPSSFSIADKSHYASTGNRSTSVGNLVIEPTTVAVAPALASNNSNNNNSYAAQSFLRKRSTARARSGLSSIMRKAPEVTNEQQLFGTTTTSTTSGTNNGYYATAATTTSERNPSELGTSAGIDVAAELGEPSRNLTSLFNSVSEDEEDEMSTNKGATTTNRVVSSLIMQGESGRRNAAALDDTGITSSGVAVDTATATVTVASQKSAGGNGAGTSTSRKVGAETGLGYLSQNEKKFLSRLRRKGGNKLQQQQQQQDASDTKQKKQQLSKQGSAALANRSAAATAPSSDTVIAAIPEEITHDDEASMPSLLTEPEMIAKRRSRLSRGSSSRATSTRPYTPPATPTFTSNDQDDMVYSTNVRTQSIRFKNTATTTTTTSSAASDDNGERQQQRQQHHRSQSPPELTGVTSPEETEFTKTSQNNDGYTTFGGTTTRGGGGSYFGTTVASGISSATAAGGIEKLLNAFNCNEDTTALSLLGGMLDGLKPLCGIMEEESAENRRKDGVDRMLEKEENFALDFQRDIIKNGIKLIHHESPSRASTNPDWIQSTIKLFIRPGNCHTSHTTQQPKLAWAVLPVVSRMQLVGDFEHSNEEEAMWNTLGLLDVHSIMVDEGDATTSGGGGNYSPVHKNGSTTGSAAAAAASSTGFFSITANNGAVHVFEAPSGKQRDYVVMGLRTIISRLAYHVIAGEPDVIGELYSEDAGQLTGELPSLVSPWKALSKVTHAFVDKQ